MSVAAVMADEYVLTHRVAFPVPASSDRPRSVPVTPSNFDKAPAARKEEYNGKSRLNQHRPRWQGITKASV